MYTCGYHYAGNLIHDEIVAYSKQSAQHIQVIVAQSLS